MTTDGIRPHRSAKVETTDPFQHSFRMLAGALAMALLCAICAEQARGAEPGSSQARSPATAASEANLALVAVPSSSRVSGETALAALNDGFDPEASGDRRRGAYGNFPSNLIHGETRKGV